MSIPRKIKLNLTGDGSLYPALFAAARGGVTGCATGTLTIPELLEVKNTTVVTYGMERVAEAITADLAAHNQVVTELISELAEPTTERSEVYGTSDRRQMEELDETGRAKAKHVRSGGEVAYPLRKYGDALGWDKDYFDRATPGEMAMQILSIEEAHIVALGNEVARALFTPTNNPNYRDLFKDGKTLHLRALLNADGSKIPDGPYGKVFDPDTHHHYMAIDWAAANTAQRSAKIKALVANVHEHGHRQGIRLYINLADETAVTSIPEFKAYQDPRIRPGANESVATGELDLINVESRAIGLIAGTGAEVWVKPWVPEGYVFCFAAGDKRKPLKLRSAPEPTRQGLRLASKTHAYPLYADNYEAYFGAGVYTRTNGAVLYLNGGVYAAPSIIVAGS